MKKRFLFLVFFLTITFNKTVFAKVGDLGFFGGITEGRKLPKTTEILLSTTTKKTDTQTMVYKEMIFLSGRPTEFEGLLTVRTSGDTTKDLGSYQVAYDIRPSETTPEGMELTRSIVFNVNYRKEGNQIIKDYEVKSWNEKIVADGQNFSIDPKQSVFSVSILEDHTPGVSYYKGNLSMMGVFTSGDNKSSNKIVAESSGDIYGYESAWSTTETHRINTIITNNDWQMQYQVRPSVGVNKILQYSQNEPTAISFRGNYREVMQNQSGMQYDIFVKPQQFYDVDSKGSLDIQTYNNFEQLIAPDLEYLRGHFAEEDIKKLFSMQVLEGSAKFYKPEQAITRGEYVSALVKAVKIPIEQEDTKKTKTKKKEVINITFPDVLPERPDYNYIMAAFKKGLAIGRSNGYFYADSPLEREEALVLLLRVLGLENLGLDPTPMTSFTDDAKISDWAKQEIYAANRIGIISGDENGNIRPKDYVTKAEASALINRLISYMRQDMQTDYSENIVNYAD